MAGDERRTALGQVLFATEDRPFVAEPQPPEIDLTPGSLRIRFHRPSAVLLSMWPAAPRAARD